MGTIKKLYQDQLVGGSGSAGQEVYPVTSTLGVYDDQNNQLQGVLDKVTTNLGLFTCGTAAATAAKTVTASKFVLMEGGSAKIKFTYANSADSPTLAIGSTAAKPIMFNGSAASASNSWGAGEIVEFFYDGTNWVGNSTSVSVSQNTSTGETDITVGDNNFVILDKEAQGNGVLLGSYLIDLSNYAKTEGALTSATPTTWNLDGYNRYHKAIPIPSGIKTITMVANENINATFVITKTYSAPTTSGESVDSATGYRASTHISAGQSAIISVPVDGAYLILVVNSNSVDMTPKFVQFSSGVIDAKIDKDLGTHKLSQSIFNIVGYISNSGNYEPNATTYRCTGYIPLYNGGVVRYNCTFGAAVYAIAVYDSSLQLVSSDSIVGNNGGSVLEYKNNSGQLRYIRMCVYYADINSCPAYIDNVGVFEYQTQTDEQITDIKEQLSYGWRYGNINTDGTPILPIAKNRIHSTLISIINLQKITTENTHYIGYALYDKDKTFITRWWDDNVNELDFALIGLSNPSAFYVSVLMMNTDNSDFNLSTTSPEINLYYDGVAALTYSPKTIRLQPQVNLPVIIFNFDDCLLPGDYEVVKLFESRGARCGFAFIATDDNITNKTKIYLDFQKRGFDIMNHSGGVQSLVTSNYTFDQAKALIVSNGLEKLQKAGFVINGFVCPNSEMSNDFFPIVAKTHAYNMLGSQGGVYGANTRDTDVNKLLRYSLENNTKADIKAYIDECIANDKCLIFYAHTSRFGQTIGGEVFNLDKVAEILDYCIAKRDNLECYIGGCDEALKYYFDLK